MGYIRVSTASQNTSRQLDGMEIDKAFIDHSSGKNRDRPELEKMLDYVREGDTVFVHSMDRLGRNLNDLRLIVSNLTKKGVEVRFVKEGLVFSGNDSPYANLSFSIMGAFAEFERELLRERQREGIKKAKERGAYAKCGRKPVLTENDVTEIKRLLAEGVPKSKIARTYGVGRVTIYNYIGMATAEKPQ